MERLQAETGSACKATARGSSENRTCLEFAIDAALKRTESPQRPFAPDCPAIAPAVLSELGLKDK